MLAKDTQTPRQEGRKGEDEERMYVEKLHLNVFEEAINKL